MRVNCLVPLPCSLHAQLARAFDLLRTYQQRCRALDASAALAACPLAAASSPTSPHLGGVSSGSSCAAADGMVQSDALMSGRGEGAATPATSLSPPLGPAAVAACGEPPGPSCSAASSAAPPPVASATPVPGSPQLAEQQQNQQQQQQQPHLEALKLLVRVLLETPQAELATKEKQQQWNQQQQQPVATAPAAGIADASIASHGDQQMSESATVHPKYDGSLLDLALEFDGMLLLEGAETTGASSPVRGSESSVSSCRSERCGGCTFPMGAHQEYEENDLLALIAQL